MTSETSGRTGYPGSLGVNDPNYKYYKLRQKNSINVYILIECDHN